MKAQVIALLSSLILVILLSSCVSTASHVQGELTVHQTYIKCPTPPKPDYSPMIEGEYFLGPNNSKILLDNMEIQKQYINELEIDLDCYLKQTK